MPPTSANELIPAAALVARFRDDLATVTGGADQRLLVAVSGGPDSVALLLLARAALGDGCRAATVDHGLRPEAADEADWVAGLCRSLRVPHATLAAPMPARAGRTANVSARARALRYRLLEEELAPGELLATAHHADDQLETLVMRLNRGAGVAGLAGIRARGGRIVRPLLGWRRAELTAIVEAADLSPVDDPSNRDERYDRARLRRVLADADWLDVARVGQSARALGDAEGALAWTARDLEDRLCRDGPGAAVTLAACDHLPRELRRRLFLRCIERIDPDVTPSGPALERLIGCVLNGGEATIGRVMVRRCAGPTIGLSCLFQKAPPRRSH